MWRRRPQGVSRQGGRLRQKQRRWAPRPMHSAPSFQRFLFTYRLFIKLHWSAGRCPAHVSALCDVLSRLMLMIDLHCTVSDRQIKPVNMQRFPNNNLSHIDKRDGRQTGLAVSRSSWYMCVCAWLRYNFLVPAITHSCAFFERKLLSNPHRVM